VYENIYTIQSKLGETKYKWPATPLLKYLQLVCSSCVSCRQKTRHYNCIP